MELLHCEGREVNWSIPCQFQECLHKCFTFQVLQNPVKFRPPTTNYSLNSTWVQRLPQACLEESIHKRDAVWSLELIHIITIGHWFAAILLLISGAAICNEQAAVIKAIFGTFGWNHTIPCHKILCFLSLISFQASAELKFPDWERVITLSSSARAANKSQNAP